MESTSPIFEYYKKSRFGTQVHFDKVASVTPGLSTPSILDVGQHLWKQQNGDTLLLIFSLTSRHISWRNIIHGGITSGMLDDIFAYYCYIESPELFPLTKMLRIDFAKPAFPNEVLFARVTKTSPLSERDDAGKGRKKLWVQGNIDTIRNHEVITLARAKALFILCEQLPVEPKRKTALLPSERSFTRMSQELWDMVIEGLPSLTGRHAAQVFGFTLPERQQKHSGIWNKILKDDETWTSIAERQGLNPFLVGDDLHVLHNDPEQPAYLALVTGDKTGIIRHDKTKLLASLRAHHWNEKNEIVFQESKIILNIDEALHNPFFITLTPKRLFGCCEHNRLRSASLYWQDNEYALRTIGPNDIVGTGEHASTLRDVSLICGITLSHPKEMTLRRRRQQCFQHPNCPPAYPLCPIGYKFNGDNILGWDWGDTSRFWNLAA